ncbi:MAG: Ldh family oxidoreductase [Planctomycetales bacterium]
MPYFDPHALQSFVARMFVAAGVEGSEAGTVATSLVESNLRGHDSHGVILSRWYLSQLKHGELVAGAPWEIVRETAGLVVADGHLGFGQVQCPRLMERLMEKARETGVASGTLRRCGHVGRLGEWVEMVAARGLAGLIAVNDNGAIRTVAPPGGIAPRLSTNPIGIAVPTGNGPLVLDISTSAVANGKLKIARLAGKPVPLGWIQDSQGNPTTDPQVMLADPPGCLLPFGGDQSYKGFGLGLLFDILVAGLAGGLCPPAPEGTLECNNVLAIVWDPELCAGRGHFLGEADKLLEEIRNTPRKAGVDRIRLPGERAERTREERLKTGILLEGEQWETLVSIAQNLNVVPPEPASM